MIRYMLLFLLGLLSFNALRYTQLSSPSSSRNKRNVFAAI
jgi:hypothetical protein